MTTGSAVVLILSSCNFSVSHLETLKQERNELQHLLQNQKFTPSDVERINREKSELQQTITSLSKSLEDAEQHRWNEEIALAKVKETVSSNIVDMFNDLKQIREQIRKLDERLDGNMQVRLAPKQTVALCIQD
ncbi:hypothetical protein XENOCAPTIV_001572 [Xenoophorus captivus]|uniref:Kinetochore protein NDC80 loop region domain-containing protein n=1 Tax=Xenoophorus captivus TaxID=1517983 RepID=A0ABV0RZ16_9TELE